MKAKSLQHSLKNEKEEVLFLNYRGDIKVVLGVAVSVDGFFFCFPGAKTSEHHCEPGQPVQS